MVVESESSRNTAPLERRHPHPLDPLDQAELASVVSVLREKVGPHARIITVTLAEPDKERAWEVDSSDPQREAIATVLDPLLGVTSEARVAVAEGRLIALEEMEGVQPIITGDEAIEAESAIKGDRRFIAAVHRRDIDDIDGVMVDIESIGSLGPAKYNDRRLAWGSVWYRDQPGGNGYAHPLENLVPIIDLNRMEVLRVEDHGVVPIPPASGEFGAGTGGGTRPSLKPLEITQPEGPSFIVEGHHVSWQGWSFRVGFTPREGLVLYTIGFEEKGRVRPIIHRASVNEMAVPYGYPSASHYRKNFLDIGEYGAGLLANSLELGCDCLGEIHYFDAAITDTAGNIVPLRNVICMHEEDFGILWKHYDWRAEQASVERARRLVISSISTFGNYDYGFFWYLYQDGTLEFEAKLTGVLSTAAVEDGKAPPHGRLIAPQLVAPNHQHFFSVRLDMCLDGRHNSVEQLESEPTPNGADGFSANAFRSTARRFRSEQEARANIDPLRARAWRVFNPSVRNELGQPVGYRFVPGENVLPFAHEGASILKRAGFIRHHLWVTRYAPKEFYAAGDYPNQRPHEDGLPKWTAADRSIENEDIVLWYTMGSNHIARPEEWPVMSVARIGFHLKPDGFFDRNPATDPSAHGEDHCR